MLNALKAMPSNGHVLNAMLVGDPWRSDVSQDPSQFFAEMQSIARFDSQCSYPAEVAFFNFKFNHAGLSSFSDHEQQYNTIKQTKPKIALEDDNRKILVKREATTNTNCPTAFCHPASVSKCDPRLRVQFLNLKHVYEKVQSRVNKQSKQRLSEGRVRMVVWFDAQISEIKVYVEREPGAAALCGDKTGPVRLKTKVGQLCANKQFLSFDLDSVYLSDKGTPVYKLSTVDSDKRNRFRIVVVVMFIDGCQSKPYVSRPFLLRSQKRSPTSRRSST